MKQIILAKIILSLFYTITFAAPGDLDTSFGTGGKVTTSLGRRAFGNDVAIQNDGKILVGGSVCCYNSMLVARYNSDGTRDSTFGSNGDVRHRIGGNNGDATGEAIALQPDGKILIAGHYSGKDVVLLRFNSDGSYDNTFDNDGVVITDAGGSGTWDFGHDVTVQSDGKILVAGRTQINQSTEPDFLVVRYNSDGSLDLSFGNNGIVKFAFGGATDIANAITTQTDGKILVAGFSWNASTSHFAVARLNTNGSLDSSFDSDGKILTPLMGTSWDIAKSIKIQSDGKILVAGEYQNSTTFNYGFAVVRYNSNGTLDTSFNSSGKILTSIVGGDEKAEDILIQPDGKILIAGYTYNGSNNDFVVARYNSDGSLDNSRWSSSISSLWGTNGFAIADFGGSDDFAKAIATDSAGRIIAVGYTPNSNPDLAIARFQGLAPTSASATISGRVLYSGKSRRGVRGAIVHMTDQKGSIKTARTNMFGYYRFEDIEVGQTLVFNVYSKRYQFETQVVNLEDSLTGFDFISQ